MHRSLFAGIVIGAVVSAVVSTGVAAVAGTGIGGVFNLGDTNAVNAVTTLQGSTTGSNLQVINRGSGSALGITVGKGKAPIVVNATAGKATNLDADKLDGKDSSAFVTGGGRTFTAHVTVSGSASKSICQVPHLGMMTAIWDGSRIDFHLTNSTGLPVDSTYSAVEGTDGLPIDPGDDLLGVGGQSNDELDVQMAWGTGHAAHFVRMTISWYLQTGSPHVLVFGSAH
jgi:hypothetical protein